MPLKKLPARVSDTARMTEHNGIEETSVSQFLFLLLQTDTADDPDNLGH